VQGGKYNIQRLTVVFEVHHCTVVWQRKILKGRRKVERPWPSRAKRQSSLLFTGCGV